MNKKQAYTHNSEKKTIMLMACAVCLFFAPRAYADCTGPAGIAGEVLFNAAVDKPQYCDGTNWKEMIKTFPIMSCTGPSDCPGIGNVCGDTTVFAGCHPVTFHRIFVYPGDQSAATTWGPLADNTGADDDQNGKVNQDWIVTNKTIANYPAFKLCDDLNIANALGHNDWYLPSRVEMHYLWYMRGYIGGGAAFSTSENYFTSTEDSSDSGKAWIVRFVTGVSYGDSYTVAKNTASPTPSVRCMRRNQ